MQHTDAHLPSREAVYCHDYQNGICRRPSCKFLHYTKKEEELFRLHGLILTSHTNNFSDNEIISDSSIPVCRDFLNRNCHRGSACKFRHCKPINNPSSSLSEKTIVYQVSEPQLYNSHPQFCDGAGGTLLPPNSRTSESASTVTTPETATAMVAAAAAAGYLALQQKQQQRSHHHQQQQSCDSYLHHQQCGTPGVVVQGASPGTVAVPSASAAAVAAAAAATAIATQQHAPLGHRYSESALNTPTSIPVMQSILGAVTNSSTPHPHCIDDSSSYSPPTSHASAVLPCHYDHRLNSHYCLKQDDQGSSTGDFTMPNHSTKSATYTNQDAINKPMNSHPPFNQHSQQQQEANTAAALAAAACFGAMLSQPVAAAAAASHAAASVTKPTAGVIGDISASLPQSSGAGSGGHTNTAAAAASNVGIVMPSPSPVVYGGPVPPPQPQPSPAPPPPQPASAAVAAAAAAAVAAAVVSSAGPSAAVAAMSAAHLATSSFSRAHSGPHVSCTSTIPALCASTSRYLATLNPPVSVESLDHHHRQMYSSNDSFSLRMTSPSSSASQQQQQICSVSSALSSSAATAVYTATMTTAVAAAAMAAAAAVEEHNQKKNAAAAAMAAFNKSAALAHEVQSISRMTEHVSLPSDSLSPANHITTSHSGISTLCLNAEMSDNQYNPRRRISSTTVSRRQQQQVTRFSNFDMDEDESYGEESNYGDDEEYETEVTTPRISRSSTPDRNFGRNPPLYNFLRKRSYSFSHLENESATESQPRPSSQSSKVSNIISRFRKRVLLSKRPKLENVDRGVTPSRHRIYRRCQNRLQQELDEESEVDEEERFCYTAEEANFYSSPSVVTPPSFRERICDLRRENAQLRVRLKRIAREHKFLQDENRSLMEQNRRLKKCVPNMISNSKCSNPQLSSRQWVIQSLKTGSQSSVSVSAGKRRKSGKRSQTEQQSMLENE
nr:Zinc finger CCCH domain containing protein 10 [Hymenolepis microstoma]